MKRTNILTSIVVFSGTLLTIFVGCTNDFLPNLPYCAIHESTLSHLFTIYKTTIGIIGDYLTHQGRMNLLECEIFFKIFSTFEQQ